MTWLVAAAALAAADRSVDFSAAAFLSAPERFALCVGMHPAAIAEVDLCSGLDRNVTALSGHVFLRKHWAPHPRFGLALGGGAGARVSRFCPFDVCALQAGPEVLASLEGVLWLTPAFGLTLQLDAGLAVVWGQVAANVVEQSYRIPARLLLGVAL